MGESGTLIAKESFSWHQPLTPLARKINSNLLKTLKLDSCYIQPNPISNAILEVVGEITRG